MMVASFCKSRHYNWISWCPKFTDLFVDCNRKCICIYLASEPNPANRNNQLAAFETGNLINIIMRGSCIIHWTQSTEVHVFAPLWCMPDFPNDPIFWYFWVYVNEFAGCGIGPVLNEMVSKCFISRSGKLTWAMIARGSFIKNTLPSGDLQGILGIPESERIPFWTRRR